MSRRALALIILALAYVALIPGILQPVIHLSGSLEKSEVAALGKELISENQSLSMFSGMANRFIDSLDVEGEVEVYRQERSIVSTVTELGKRGHILVAFLVGLFSVIVPVVKGGLTFYGHTGAWSAARQKSANIASAISKWSMADVFVIALFVTFLAARATQNSGELVRFDADFGTGFYFFGLYCLLSILASTLLPARSPHEHTAPVDDASAEPST
ncbi:MAG: paraquat-inducible protein A [Pseudomonadota bacterium]